MLGIIIGTAAVLGAASFCRHRLHRYGYGYGGRYGHHGCHSRSCGPRGGWHGYDGHEGSHGDHEGFFGGHAGGPWSRGPWGRGGFGGGGMADRWASMLAWRLEASPSQSEVIRAAFRSVHDDLHAVGDERKATREDLGKAVGGERFDEQVMGELFARHDERLSQLRASLVGALAKVHEVLEPVQRERLAALFGKRSGGAGPYRM